MHTCQAVWFRADDDRDAPEPDFQAFTQMDVLNSGHAPLVAVADSVS